jgi:hypothetical protein
MRDWQDAEFADHALRLLDEEVDDREQPGDNRRTALRIIIPARAVRTYRRRRRSSADGT